MKSFNMSNYQLFSHDLLYWPQTNVKEAWHAITFDFEEIIDKIGLRYNNGTYLRCTEFQKCSFEKVFQIKPLSTLHNGRCYTLEFSPQIQFFETDNIIIYFKRNINLYIHGRGQEIGLIANFFPVEPAVYTLNVQHLHKLDFSQLEKVDILGCQESVKEEDYYHCFKKEVKAKELLGKQCLVPMFESIVNTKRFVN